MTYSRSPYVTTYSTEPIQLLQDLKLFPANEAASWGGTTTAESTMLSGAVNVLPFKDEDGEVYGETRYGLTGSIITGGNGTSTRGYYYWERAWSGNFDLSYQFLVTNDATASRLWGNVTGGSWTQLTTLNNHTASGICRFTEFIDATNNKSLVMSDGTDLYVITIVGGSPSATRVTDLDLPTPHIPFPVFIDGYIFLAKQGTGDIYNCDLNDPTSWTPGNFISAEMYPDDIVALVKVDNFLLAIGQYSSEYFYDAGNASGSPLARYSGGVLPFGTSCPNSIAYNRNTVMMLASGEGGEPHFKIIQGFKHSDFPGKAAIALYQKRIQQLNQVDNVRAGFIRMNDSMFYFFVPDGSYTDASWTAPTLMASLEHKVWTMTRSDLLNTGTPSGAYAFPVLFSCTPPAEDGWTRVAGQFGATAGAFVGAMSPEYQTDTLDSTTYYQIYQQFITPPERFGTWNKKFMYRLALDYLVIPSNDVAAQALGIQIQWSDNRGVTWHGGYLLGQSDFPFVMQLGTFRERMFKISALSNRQRWRPMEADINKGNR